MDWYQFISSDLALRSQFPDGPPSLSDLDFLELKYRPGNILTLTVITPIQKNGLPDRWLKQGASRIEFTLRMGIVSAVIDIPKEYDDGITVNIQIKPSSVKVEGNQTSNKFLIEAKTFSIGVTARPFFENELLP
jgi:hypothetical protein